MRSTLSIISAPAQEPVSVALAKQHCRIDWPTDDNILPGQIAAARSMAESYLSRALISQTLLWTLMPESSLRPDVHFLRGALQLPRAPVASIESVTVLDEFGNSTAITAASLPVPATSSLQGYIADLAQTPARLTIGQETVLADGRTIRQATLQNAQVEFRAGYSDDGSGIPLPIIQAILLIVAFLYEHRGDQPAEMPQAAEWLLDPYRIHWMA